MTANKLSRIFLAGLIFLFCTLIFLPVFEEGAKWDYVIPTALLIGVFTTPVFIFTSNWRNYSIKLLGVLLMWYIFLVLHRQWFPPSTEYAFNKLPLLVFVSAVCTFIIPAAVENSRAWHVTAVALTAVSIAFVVISFFPATDTSNARYSVIDLSPTLLAKLTVIPIIAALSFKNAAFWIRTLLFVSAILAVAGCINTGSKTPLIAMCLAYTSYLLVRFRLSEIVKSSGIYVVFGSAFLIYLGFANPEVVNRFSFQALSIANNSGQGDRIYLYQLAIEIIKSNPMGIGLGNFSTVFWIVAPHNIYLEATAETGWLGLIPVMLLTWIGLKSSIYLFRRDDPFGKFIAIFFVYNLITSLVGNELTLSSLMFYLSTGLSAVYASSLQRERKSPNHQVAPRTMAMQPALHS